MVRDNDPLAALTPRALRRLARRAHRTRGRGQRRFARLAERTGVSLRQLRLLADAWAAGGPSGVVALGRAPAEVDAEELRRADATLEAWRARHYPLEALSWDTWRNQITVWQLLPSPDRRGAPQPLPLLQLRLTADGHWHLYRKAAQGEWWPVPVVDRGRARQDLEACLATVGRDVGNVFWHEAEQ